MGDGWANDLNGRDQEGDPGILAQTGRTPTIRLRLEMLGRGYSCSQGSVG